MWAIPMRALTAETGRDGTNGKENMTGIRSERGQSIVELALVLPLLVVLAIAATDFAHGVSEYTQVVNAANAGAQYGSTGPSESTNATAISAAVQADLGSLYPQTGASITSSASDDGTGESLNKVTVTVSIPYHMSIPFIGYFAPSYTLTSRAVMRVDPYNS